MKTFLGVLAGLCLVLAFQNCGKYNTSAGVADLKSTLGVSGSMPILQPIANDGKGGCPCGITVTGVNGVSLSSGQTLRLVSSCLPAGGVAATLSGSTVTAHISSGSNLSCTDMVIQVVDRNQNQVGNSIVTTTQHTQNVVGRTPLAPGAGAAPGITPGDLNGVPTCLIDANNKPVPNRCACTNLDPNNIRQTRNCMVTSEAEAQDCNLSAAACEAQSRGLVSCSGGLYVPGAGLSNYCVLNCNGSGGIKLPATSVCENIVDQASTVAFAKVGQLMAEINGACTALGQGKTADQAIAAGGKVLASGNTYAGSSVGGGLAQNGINASNIGAICANKASGNNTAFAVGACTPKDRETNPNCLCMANASTGQLNCSLFVGTFGSTKSAGSNTISCDPKTTKCDFKYQGFDADGKPVLLPGQPPVVYGSGVSDRPGTYLWTCTTPACLNGQGTSVSTATCASGGFSTTAICNGTTMVGVQISCGATSGGSFPPATACSVPPPTAPTAGGVGSEGGAGSAGNNPGTGQPTGGTPTGVAPGSQGFCGSSNGVCSQNLNASNTSCPHPDMTWSPTMGCHF